MLNTPSLIVGINRWRRLGRVLVTNRAGTLLPKEACDSHMHVFDPERFPYQTERSYTPPAATISAVKNVHKRLGCSRTVVVQPSVYGVDVNPLIDTLRSFGGNARGIAIVGKRTTTRALSRLHDAGVRGVRLIISEKGPAGHARMVEFLRLAKILPAEWILSVNAPASTLAAVAPQLRAVSRRVVLEHYAHLAPAMIGTEQFRTLIRLLLEGNTFLKLSGPYQLSDKPDYCDLKPIVTALVGAVPQQLLWGSNWPHTLGAQRDPNANANRVEPLRVIDDLTVVEQLLNWIPGPTERRQIFVDTPAELFGFEQ